MKPTKNKFFIFVTLFGVFLIVAFVYVFLALRHPNNGSGDFVNFEIKPGESLSLIGQDLYAKKLINSETLFRLYAHFDKRGNLIQTGLYKIPGNLTLNALMNTFVKGPGDLKLTFIEGWRREEMAELVSKSLPSATGYQDFMKASVDSEGFIFPDTYFFPQQVLASSVVDLLTTTFKDKVTPKIQAGFASQNLSLGDAVTLASIVEREAATDADRQMVAGVLLNRLKAEWFLNADATVQYAVASNSCLGQSNCDWWPKSLSSNDLKIDSPYNTYVTKGLPPAPICNPSLSALEAVASPAKSDYLFYLTGTDGVFHYAKTIEEHNQNISKYL